MKRTKFIIIVIVFELLASCRLVGFYEPITLDTEIPDGPPEYRSGWRAGCRSGLGTSRSFTNAAAAYEANYGTGVYLHDPAFATGWGQGFFACVIHTATFVERNAMRHGPLE